MTCKIAPLAVYIFKTTKLDVFSIQKLKVQISNTTMELLHWVKEENYDQVSQVSSLTISHTAGCGPSTLEELKLNN